MAVTPTSVTQNLTSPILEGSLTAFLKTLEPLIGQKVDTSVYAPKIAAESALQQQARTAAGGLGSLIGPDAYKQYMSPYQQEVIDTTLSEYDRQAAIQRQGIGQQAIRSGAFGGGREGVQLAEYDVGSAAKRAMSLAQLLQSGYQNAQTAANQQFTNAQGLGQYQTQIGQAGQAQQQALLDASQIAAKESAFEPFTRLGLVGQQLTGLVGGFPTQVQTYQQQQQPPSPFQSFLGTVAGLGGLAGKIFG